MFYNFVEVKLSIMKNPILLIVSLLMVAVGQGWGQEGAGDTLVVAFWNLENFFDPFVDSARSYNEFTEQGGQHWTARRFYRKRNNLYKTILAFSDGKPVGIMGVCEVENEYCLNALFNQTPLKRFHYRWVHFEGPDRRGIDPAIVYSKDLFQLVHSEAIPYRNPAEPQRVSRDILYAKFFDYKHDTIHCFVNHWPSKYSGELETVEARNCAARILRHKVDSIRDACRVGNRQRDRPHIIIMGDFNDVPQAPCVKEVLKARSRSESDGEDLLVNLFADPDELGFPGTLKYQDTWMIFDQIIVSKSLVYNDSSNVILSDARIVCEPFLLVEDKTYHGKKLFRTYLGPKYQGGFSDHLPVVARWHYVNR